MRSGQRLEMPGSDPPPDFAAAIYEDLESLPAAAVDAAAKAEEAALAVQAALAAAQHAGHLAEKAFRQAKQRATDVRHIAERIRGDVAEARGGAEQAYEAKARGRRS